jgi:hypothetical protein
VNGDPAATAAEAQQVDAGAERPAGSPGEPSEQELRAAYEAELRRISSADMMLQAAVSLLNVGGYRLGLGGSAPGTPAAADRDLEQVRDAIDGVRALVGILERRIPQELGPLRDALSQLQIAYAREVQAGGATAQPAAGETRQQGASPEAAQPGGATPPAAEQARPEEQPGQPAVGERPAGPGPAQSSGRLWVPGS